ncbi:hypothetical protein OPV22_030483 [Ensete ventricosum]|uniref:Uncharacterized protein n=1 Tax=Ensete ventricosum TaxID=4639 RepID=A0AAV8QE81_ENSVE|nr:hypothetical protein OPV22_030483 [Ensete ventricosum]
MLPIRNPSPLSSPRHGSRLGDQRSPKLFRRKQSVYRNLVLSDFSFFRSARFLPIRHITTETCWLDLVLKEEVMHGQDNYEAKTLVQEF